MTPPPDLLAAEGDTIWAVEEALAAPPFGSMRVGAFVNDLLLRLANGGSVAALSDTLRLAEALVHRTGQRKPVDGPSLSGQVLVTLIDDSARIADLVLPVVEELGGGATVLPARPELGTMVGTPAQVIQDRHLGVDDRSAWYRQVRRAAPGWTRSLRTLVRQGHLPREAVPAVAHLLAVQTARALRYQQAFELDRPSGVLVEYDRGTFAVPIVAAARSLGIPTATMVHGSIHPRGYTPLVADLAFCWGDAQADQLVAAGAAPDHLVITGCQRMGLASWTPGKARADLGLDERPVIVLATNNLLDPAARVRLARVALEAVATLGDTVQLGLRLHPREMADDYRELIDTRVDLQLLGGDRASGDQVLAAADLVVCGLTAFADEAVIAGVPAMIIDLDGQADVTVGLGASGPVATNRAELADHLHRWARDDSERARLRELAATRGRELCAATGRDAARLVAGQVRAMVRDGSGRRG